MQILVSAKIYLQILQKAKSISIFFGMFQLDKSLKAVSFRFSSSLDSIIDSCRRAEVLLKIKQQTKNQNKLGLGHVKV